MDLELHGRVALVTGGSRGIGKAIARVLAEEGADVALAARNRTAVEATARELAQATGRRIEGFACDTGVDADVKTLVERVMAAHGRVDILVNSAAKPSGQSLPPKLAEVTNEEFLDHMNVKVMGYLRVAREVVPHMRARSWGRIVNVSGLGARQTGNLVGSMRNVAVMALTKNLADELAGSGITVNCVHPGLTRTEATPGVVAWQAKRTGKPEADIERGMAERNLVRHLVDAREVAFVVAFLCSPKALAVNGSAIDAGGGSPGSIHY